MTPDHRPSHYGERSYSHVGKERHGTDTSLASEKIQIERKTFFFALKENPRGRFLRITEDVNGRRDSIVIPATGLDDFRKGLEAMINASNDGPLPKSDS